MADIQEFMPMSKSDYVHDNNNEQLITIITQIRDNIDRLEVRIKALEAK